jgi:hypothetical protein
MSPLFDQGFGFTALLLMISILFIAGGVKWLKARIQRNSVKPPAAAPGTLQVRPALSSGRQKE